MIEGYIILKPFLLSNDLSSSVVDCIKEAVSELNTIQGINLIILTGIGLVTETHTISYITDTIQSKSFAFTNILGYWSNNWFINSTNIFIKKNIIHYNTCYNVVMHELCHALGLTHNNITNSVMNSSVKIDTRGTDIKTEKWKLHPIDIYNLFKSSTRFL